jgi:hypothetical protein
MYLQQLSLRVPFWDLQPSFSRIMVRPYQLGFDIMKLQLAVAASAAFALIAVDAAKANVAVIGESSAYTLSVSDPAANLGAGPYGTVSVLELNAQTLQLTVDLNDPTYQFKDSGNNHPAVAFNIAGDPLLTFAFSSPAGGTTASGTFSGTNTNQNASPFGDFNSAVLFAAAPQSASYPGPLVFTISSASGLDISSFTPDVYLGNNIYFAVDVRNTTTGFTGNVGALLTGNNIPGGGGVPVPATWGLMIMGFGGVGALLRNRRRTQLAL